MLPLCQLSNARTSHDCVEIQKVIHMFTFHINTAFNSVYIRTHSEKSSGIIGTVFIMGLMPVLIPAKSNRAMKEP